MALIRDDHGTVQTFHNGDNFSQKEFHRLYEDMPEGFRAELIDGTVFVREPLGPLHGNSHMRFSTLFDVYSAATPGVEGYIDATVILGEKDEVQPDVVLRILPSWGGRSRDHYVTVRGKRRGPYISGAPELVGEVAHSSRAIDLHQKLKRYEAAGIDEYIVLALSPLQLLWFDLRNGGLIEPDSTGIACSNAFPGLWIDPRALLKMNLKKSLEAIRVGVSSAEHRAFCGKLKAAKRSK